ncbi:hypothetical protein PanWU01x14_026500, partial [Parasponia andersonii]
TRYFKKIIGDIRSDLQIIISIRYFSKHYLFFPSFSSSSSLDLKVGDLVSSASMAGDLVFSTPVHANNALVAPLVPASANFIWYKFLNLFVFFFFSFSKLYKYIIFYFV